MVLSERAGSSPKKRCMHEVRQRGIQANRSLERNTAIKMEAGVPHIPHLHVHLLQILPSLFDAPLDPPPLRPTHLAALYSSVCTPCTQPLTGPSTRSSASWARALTPFSGETRWGW